MKLTIHSDNGDVLHLRVAGRIAMATIGDQADVIPNVLDQRGYGRSVLLDLSEAEYIDSGGVSWLVITNKRFNEADGKLVIHSIPAVVLDIFKMMRLDRVFNLTDAEPAALALLQGENR